MDSLLTSAHNHNGQQLPNNHFMDIQVKFRVKSFFNDFLREILLKNYFYGVRIFF